MDRKSGSSEQDLIAALEQLYARRESSPQGRLPSDLDVKAREATLARLASWRSALPPSVRPGRSTAPTVTAGEQAADPTLV
jgi:hypothetical protein